MGRADGESEGFRVGVAVVGYAEGSELGIREGLGVGSNDGADVGRDQGKEVGFSVGRSVVGEAVDGDMCTVGAPDGIAVNTADVMVDGTLVYEFVVNLKSLALDVSTVAPEQSPHSMEQLPVPHSRSRS